jgi:hypothetical protein
MSGPDMTYEARTLLRSLENDAPPDELGGPLLAHWHSAKGNRRHALQILEADASKTAAWVRAHLHRRHGEDELADEWYGRAGRKPSEDTVDVEWSSIAAVLLVRGG